MLEALIEEALIELLEALIELEALILMLEALIEFHVSYSVSKI